jgi:hypothetical protein
MVFCSALLGKENLAAQAAGISTDGAQEMQKAVGSFLYGLAPFEIRVEEIATRRNLRAGDESNDKKR